MFTPKTALPLTARSCALSASISIKDFLNASYFSFSSPVDEYCPNGKRDVERQTFALQISCSVLFRLIQAHHCNRLPCAGYPIRISERVATSRRRTDRRNAGVQLWTIESSLP